MATHPLPPVESPEITSSDSSATLPGTPDPKPEVITVQPEVREPEPGEPEVAMNSDAGASVANLETGNKVAVDAETGSSVAGEPEVTRMERLRSCWRGFREVVNAVREFLSVVRDCLKCIQKIRGKDEE